MRERKTRDLLNKAEVFDLSGSGDGATVKKEIFMNKIAHGTHHTVDVRAIFDCNGHM